MILCTLFNWAYLPQGVALYRSLARTAGDDFVLYALCMDMPTAGHLLALNLPHLRIVLLSDIEDEALLAVKERRTIGEYCWTCTTSLVLYVQDLHPEGAVVTYVDADIAFLSHPRAILDEMGDGSIFIHEHDFSPEHAGLIASSGRFNVGVTAFRNDPEGRACLELWRSQCLDECVMDPAAGKCGDQNYLDDWPDLYPNLVISARPGIGLAPWNVSKRAIALGDGGTVRVDGEPAVFYHYHGLKLLRPRLRVHPTLIVGSGYRMPPEAVQAFYRPYARELWSIARLFPKIIESLRPLPDLHPRIGDGQVAFSLMDRQLPMERNNTTMAYLYGFDPAREPRAAAR